MPTDVMIQADRLTKLFGSVRALENVSFEVRRGEVVGFLGPNGAGKSTTMRILTCFISPTHGAAKVSGYDVFDQPLEVRRSLGYLPQRAPLYPEMTVWSYLEFTARMRGLDPAEFKRRLRKVVEVCGLAQSLGRDIRTLSHGYRQRVGLAQALIHNPPILILDEPTSDLDPNEKAEVISYIREIGKERTVLLSTHNLSEVQDSCARAIIISQGRVVADGALDEIRSKSGKVRTMVGIHDSRSTNGSPPSAAQVRDALSRLGGVDSVHELPGEEGIRSFELLSDGRLDLRPEVFRLVVDKGWVLLELHRDTQTLKDVFRDLTRGDARIARGSGAEDGDRKEAEGGDENSEDSHEQQRGERA